MGLFNDFRYFVYPQFNWSKEIYCEIINLLNHDASIIDAPFGNGIISYWLSKKKQFNKTSFELVDISTQNIDQVNDWKNNNRRVKATAEDIFKYKIKNNSNENIWLLINSLYLFEDPNKLINWGKIKNKYIIGVFPNIESENYQQFMQTVDFLSNPSACSKIQTIELFKRNGFNLLKENKLSNFNSPLGLRNELRAIVKRYLAFKELFSNKEGKNYWLGVFEREF